MGKTADGAIWLNEDRLSAFDFWQFWRNSEDADVARFLALFTELPMDEVERLGNLEGAEINEAKIVLADKPRRCATGRTPRAAPWRRHSRHLPATASARVFRRNSCHATRPSEWA